MRTKRRWLATLVCLLLTAGMYGQGAAYSKAGTGSQSCQGANMQGAWMTPGTWDSDPGVSVPPGNTSGWNGNRLEIRHKIIICNNDDIDMRSSNLDTLIFRAGSSLHFRANGALLLPEGAVVIMEQNSMFYTSNNSQGTLLTIGNDSIWGKSIDCIPVVMGPRTITDTSAICIQETPLPVTLVSFTVSKREEGAQLNWMTASELNSDYFEIQRSSDGLTWEGVFATSAAGQSLEPLEYEWLDGDPLPGTSYYRLKQVDYDGEVHYFPVVDFQFSEVTGFSFQYINPVRDFLDMQIAVPSDAYGSDLNLSVYDMQGRSLVSTVVSADRAAVPFQLPVSGWKQGIYLFTAIHRGEVVHAMRFAVTP